MVVAGLAVGAFFTGDLLAVALFGAAIGGIASFVGGAGARNTNALNKDKAVSKAMDSVNKVLGRMNSNYYSSARYAQAAFTNVSNRLGKAIIQTQMKMFLTSMALYGLSTIVNNAIMTIF